MYFANKEELSTVKRAVLLSFTPDEGSIMYMGSDDMYHYFKASVSRRNVKIQKFM